MRPTALCVIVGVLLLASQPSYAVDLCPVFDTSHFWIYGAIPNDQAPCSYSEHNQTISCNTNLLQDVANYTLTTVNSKGLKQFTLAITCYGYPLSRTKGQADFGQQLADAGLEDLSLQLSYCDLSYTPLNAKSSLRIMRNVLPDELAPIVPMITDLSITCSLIANNTVLPNTEDFTALAFYTLNNNIYYPQGFLNANDQLGYFRRVPYHISFEDAVPCTSYLNATDHPTPERDCWCVKDESISLYCFNVLESRLLNVTSQLASYDDQQVTAVTVYNLHYDMIRMVESPPKHDRLLGFMQESDWPKGTVENITISGCTPLPSNATIQPNYVWERLEELQHIKVLSCFVNELRDTFPMLPMVQTVEFSNTNTTNGRLDLWQIAGGELWKMIYAGNHISELDQGTIARFVNGISLLKWLDLSFNGITTAASDSFKELLALTHLDLSHNLLQNLDPLWFRKETTPNLEWLDLSYNPIYKLLPSMLGQMPNLRYLGFIGMGPNSKINKDNIHPNALAGLNNLHVLDIGGTDMRQYPARFMWFLQSIQKLNMRQTDLTNFESFSNLTALRGINVKPSGKDPCRDLGHLSLLNTIEFDALSCGAVSDSAMYKLIQINVDAGLWRLGPESHCGLLNATTKQTTRISVLDYIEQTDFSNVNLTTDYVATSALPFYNLTALQTQGGDDEPPPNEDEWWGLAVGAVGTTIIAFVCIIPCIILTKDDWMGDCKAQKKKARDKARNKQLASVDTVVKKKKKKSMIEKFYSTTSFNGFNYILDSNFAVEKMCWYLIFLVFTGFLLHDLTILYRQYRYGDPVTQMTLPSNKTFRMPDFSFCVPLQSINVTLSADDVNRMFGATFCNPTGDPLYSNLGVRIFLQYIGRQMIAEAGMLDNNTEYTMMVNQSVVGNYLKKTNRTLKQMLQRASAEVCKLMRIQGLIAPFKARGNFETPLTTVPFTEQQCMSLVTQYPQYGISWYDEWSIDKKMCVRFPGIFTFTGTRQDAALQFFQWHDSEDAMLDFDPSGYEFPLTMERNGQLISLPLREKTTIVLNLNTKVQLLEFDQSGHRLCYADCVAFTRIDELKMGCGCKPVMWSGEADDSLPECTLQQALACNKTNMVQTCAGASQCVRYKFNIETLNHGVRAQGDTQLHLSIRNTGYESVAQQLPMTISVFMSNIGGVLGLWVGATFMGIVHVLGYFLRVLEKIFYEKTAKKAIQSIRRRTLSNSQSKRRQGQQNSLDQFSPAPAVSLSYNHQNGNGSQVQNTQTM